jgi:alkylated DNA repair dioxygenase AlkB
MSTVIYTPIINDEKSLFYYYSNILDNPTFKLVDKWVHELEYRDGNCVSGKEIPRKQLWFQKDRQYFCTDWKNRYDRWEPHSEYPKLLDTLSDKLITHVEPVLNTHGIESPDLNSCLINKYRDGNDSIRAHRDTYLSFGHTPVIFGLSIGDSRILRVRKLHHPEIFKSLKVQRESDEHIDFVLENNSLFVMAGYSQKYFSHEIPKMDDKTERYSLTFREYI